MWMQFVLVCSKDCIFCVDLGFFRMEQKIMYLFYQTVIESIIRYDIMVWFGNLTIQVKSKLACLLKIAIKTIGRKEYFSLESLYEQSVLREAHKILDDPLHVLQTEYELLPSGSVGSISK